MSAAHELVERGFDVEVYERQNIPGGKARSIPVFESLDDRGSQGVQGRAVQKWLRMRGYDVAPHEVRGWLPGEHGFRFFPGFYKHIIDTMDRTPYGQGRVSDNFIDTSEVMLTRFGGERVVLPSRFPRTLKAYANILDFLVKLVSGGTGVPFHEVEFFAARVWQVMTSCEERRLHSYEKIDWWDFVGASQRSPNYQNFFAHGFTRSLVASQAHLASARTVGNMHLQLLFDIVDPTISTADRLLNGPSNDVWIRPWLNYLEEQGVKYHVDCTVQSINCSGGVVRGVIVEKHGRKMEVTGDCYVAALPVEQMAPLVNPGLTEADPRLSHLSELAKNTAWMNGIQFFTTRRLPIAHGHVIYVDSPWALTSVSQAQFWPRYDLTKYGVVSGDPKEITKDILSVDISDWNTPGLNGKRARDCTREEIANETWKQIARSLNGGGRATLHTGDLDDNPDVDHWFLDPDIQGETEQERRLKNGEPLLVNLKDTWRLRPEAVTAIPNLFLASDYVQTYTDLATMEGANEAARRAVNGIIEACGSPATPCRLWKLEEPEILRPFREYDRLRWGAGLPWDDRLTSVALSLLGLVQKMVGLSSEEIGYHPTAAGSPRLASNRIGLSSENGLAQVEGLLQEILSMVEGGRMQTFTYGASPGEAGRDLGSSSQQRGSASAVVDRPQSCQRLRIVQKQ